MKPRFDFVLSAECQKLVEENLCLVASVVRQRFRRCSMPFKDLVQEGYFGLMSAAHYYLQRNMECKFSTFAVPRIIQRLKYVLTDKDKLAYLAEKIKKLYYVETGTHISDEDLAMILGCTILELPKKPKLFSLNTKQNDIETTCSNERYVESFFGEAIKDDRLSPLNLLVLKEMTLQKQERKIQKVKRLRKDIADYSDW